MGGGGGGRGHRNYDKLLFLAFIRCWYFSSDLLGDILEKQPVLEDDIDTLIVVDNVPIVGEDRMEKLKNVIRKVFSKFGKIVNEYYPEENGKTKGLGSFIHSPILRCSGDTLNNEQHHPVLCH